MSRAKFVTGSPMRHIVVMTGASTLSLFAIFAVDLVDMFFLSLLGEVALAAAIGFAGSILFFTTSVCIGMAIAAGALVSRALGAEDEGRAAQYYLHVGASALGLTVPLAGLMWWFIPDLLGLLGAEGRALELGTAYLQIIIPSMPVLALAMVSNATLRALGDPKRSTAAMLTGGLVNAVMDPILIFGLDLGVEGAAWASVLSRATIFVLAVGWVYRVYGLIGRFQWRAYLGDVAAITRVAGPALLTNIATPIGTAYVTAAMAVYGSDDVAASAVINRLTPLTFAPLFALSGAIGPIFGQNFGAQRPDRVRQTLLDSYLLVAGYAVAIYAVMFLARHEITAAFSLDGLSAELVIFYCAVLVPSFGFNGLGFASNAAFNNLGVAHYATVANIAKETLGTIPLVYVGSALFGAPGALAGRALAMVVVGTAGALVALGFVNRLGPRAPAANPAPQADG
ncbi:MAG: MATE family efflux transporter [Candidatus Competibacterales bacterium]